MADSLQVSAFGYAASNFKLLVIPSSGPSSTALTPSHDGYFIQDLKGSSIRLPPVKSCNPGFSVTVWANASTYTSVAKFLGDPASILVDYDTLAYVNRGNIVRFSLALTDSNTLTWVSDVVRQKSIGSQALGIGDRAIANGASALAIGTIATASSMGSMAIGTSAPVASGTWSTAIGCASTQAGAQAVGSGAMALGGSYASGADSFAAAIGDNSSTYGAQGSNSIAIGYQAKTTGLYGLALSSYSLSTGARSVAVGYGSAASGTDSLALGRGATASADNSTALGFWSKSLQFGKYSFSGGVFSTQGDCQLGALVLRGTTVNATPSVISSDAGVASTLNQLILPNDSSYTFTGSLIARNTATDTESKAWTFFGAIRRGVAAANTALIGTPGINLLGADTGTSAWTVALSADTTNGGLAVTVTGEAAKTIVWVCRIDTVEVTG